MNNAYKIFNAIIFQAGWLICVLTSNVMSLIFTATYIAIHLLFLYCKNKKFSLIREIFWLALFIVLGFICESAFFNSGILYKTDLTSSSTLELSLNQFIFPPIWLLCLWALFSISMRTSLLFILNKPLLAYALIIVMSPCSYYAGAKLNTQVDIAQPLILNLSIIGLTWVFVMASIIVIKRHYFKDIDYV